MDIKAQITEQVSAIVKKVQSDPAFAKKFQENPEKAIEGVAGIDIPDGMVDQVVTGVKAKLTADKASSKAAGALDGIKKLF